jgi:two-component sensor histidine kinase
MLGWWNRIGLKAQFMMITALNVAVTAVGVVIIVGWFQSQQIEEKLHSFSVNELQSLHALVISAMNRRPGDTQNVAIGVFNDWFQGRNTDYPGKLWSVWGTKTTAYMRTQDHARPPKKLADAIDDEALRTGKPVGRFVNGAYRYSLPIVFGVTAGADGKNCAMCHGQLMGEKKGGVIAVFSSSLSTSADFAALRRFLLLLLGCAILAAATMMAVIWVVFERLVSPPLTMVTGAMTVLAMGEKLLHQKDEAIQYQSLITKESNHRLLNEMQLVASLLSMQSRASSNAETADQLNIAANRVSMIARIHRRLHSFDGMQTVGFRRFLEEYCREFSEMLSLEEGLKRIVVADGVEIELPAATVVPLAFIVSELLTNAVKYGEGQIDIRLESGPEKGYLLLVSNMGPALPHGFDPASGNGLGMKIINSFVKQIGGELRFGPADGNRGAQFTILFS